MHVVTDLLLVCVFQAKLTFIKSNKNLNYYVELYTHNVMHYFQKLLDQLGRSDFLVKMRITE